MTEKMRLERARDLTENLRDQMKYEKFEREELMLRQILSDINFILERG